MKTLDMRTPCLPSPFGFPRPRLYERDELAEALEIRPIEVSRLRKKYNIAPVFNVRPLKFRLADFKAAIAKERGEFVPQIEKNIPIPPKRPTSARTLDAAAKIALLKEVGDSILALGTEIVHIRKAAQKAGCKIVTRRVLDIAEEMYRVWRMA